MSKRTLAAIGCGGRTYTYVSLAMTHWRDRFDIVAAADPIRERAERLRSFAHTPASFRVFENDNALLAEERLADIMIIGTQDTHHVQPCLAAMQKGYDILLEKPIATRPADILMLADTARRLGRRVMVCHVLRYAPFYDQVKQCVDSGQLGEIRSIHASEGVGPWHFAHSYVRGHWRRSDTSCPMIVAKSCHDTDILAWLIGDPCISVASVGSLSHFRAACAPVGAPARCTDGCPHADTCPYNALQYLTAQRKWLAYVCDREQDHLDRGGAAPDAEIREWLQQAPWGRCVYRCDNDAPDHQTAQFQFAGGQTATLTVTAFDDGRNIEICGTRGVLRGGHALRHRAGLDADYMITDHATVNTTYHRVDEQSGGYDGHGGGDYGLVSQLYDEMTQPDPMAIRASIHRSVEGHLMAFAAEAARLHGRTIEMSGRMGMWSDPGSP